MQYKIAIIGAGNLARSLAAGLENAGHFVTDVYSRDIRNAKRIAEKCYDAHASNELDFRTSKAQVFLIAVKDDVIEEVLSKIQVPENAILAHTSGTCGINVFSFFFPNAGVFYPIQSFSPNSKLNWSHIPICLEATSAIADKVLEELASSISQHLVYLDSQQRMRLHLAAVVACNFTNHLLVQTEEFLDEHDLDFELMKPLIAETINKALAQGPQHTQTGPAIRGDMQTIRAHIALLDKQNELKEIYQLLTDCIAKRR